MKFEKVNHSEILPGYKRTKIQDILEKFEQSNIVMAEVIIAKGEYSSMGALQSSINHAAERYKKKPGITCKIINQKAYLINNTLLEKEQKDMEKEGGKKHE